jgi:hypothetical protein
MGFYCVECHGKSHCSTFFDIDRKLLRNIPKPWILKRFSRVTICVECAKNNHPKEYEDMLKRDEEQYKNYTHIQKILKAAVRCYLEQLIHLTIDPKEIELMIQAGYYQSEEKKELHP